MLGTETATTLALGVIGSLIAAALWKYVSLALPTRSLASAPLTGIYLGRVDYTYASGNRDGWELIRIKENNGKVSMYLEHYDSTIISPRIYKGEGIFRPPLFSAFYYMEDRNSYESGVMTFDTKTNIEGLPLLQGKYFQIIDRSEKDYSGLVSEDYRMIKIKLPFSIQIPRLIGKTYFKNYETIKLFVAKLPKQTISLLHS